MLQSKQKEANKRIKKRLNCIKYNFIAILTYWGIDPIHAYK